MVSKVWLNNHSLGEGISKHSLVLWYFRFLLWSFEEVPTSRLETAVLGWVFSLPVFLHHILQRLLSSFYFRANIVIHLNSVTPLHICLPANHQPSTCEKLTQSGVLKVISLRYLRDTLHNTNNLVPVMLCQYHWTQDRCCYYFVISTFRTSWRTSEILLPRTRMSTNDRTVGKEQQICYHWQKAVMDIRAGEHPQHNSLQTGYRSKHTVAAEGVTKDLNTCLIHDNNNNRGKSHLEIINIVINKSNPLYRQRSFHYFFFVYFLK